MRLFQTKIASAVRAVRTAPQTFHNATKSEEERRRRKKENRERGESRMDPLHSLNILTTVSTSRRGAFSMLVGPWRHSFGPRWTLPNGADLSNDARRRAETVRVTVRLDLWPLRFCCRLLDEKGTKLLPAKGQLPSVATVPASSPSLDYTSSKPELPV